MEISEHTSSTNPFVLGGLAATTVAAATAAGVLHSEFKESIDSLTDSEFVGTMDSEPKENLDSLGSVSTDRNLDHSLPDLSNTMDEPVSTQLQIDESATELAQPESRELLLEQETFNVPQQEIEKIAHIDDIASIEDSEAEVDALPINTAKSLEDNSSSPKSVSILEDGASSAAVATSGSISAHEANAHTILSPEPNSPKEFAPSQPTFNRVDSSPLSAARSPGAARWTPEPPSTGSSPQLEPWSPKEVKFSLPPSPTAAAQGSQQPTEGLLPDPLSAGEANLHSLSSSNDIAVLGTASLGVASAATVAKVIYDEHQPLAVSDEALETEEIDSHILAASRTVPSYLDLEHDRSDLSTQTHPVDDGAIPPIVQIPEGNVAASFAIQSPAEAARSPGAAIWTPAPSSTDSSPALEPWSPKEVQFSFPAPSNETSIEPLELSSVSREIEGANEKSLGMEVTEKLEADSTIHANEESDESDSENNVSISADKAILNASALGAVSVIGATAIAKALPSDEAAESPALESEYIEKSVPVEQVQLEQTTSSQSSHIKETSDFNSSETSNLEDSISISTEHHQIIESVPLDVGSPAVPHRSPGADVWTPAPSSTDSSPAIEPWSPKEVHFSLPNSPVLNDQSRSHFSSDLTDVPPTELMEPISLDESAEHVQANASLDESHKASETEYPATGEPFAVSVLHDEVTSSFVESTKDETEPVAKPEVEASDPNSHSSTDSFAVPGIAAGVVASVAAGVGASHVIKAQLENSDDEDNASIPPMTESSSISRAIDSPVQADICEPRMTPPTLTISDINGVAVTEEETDESDLETSDIINDHDVSPIQTDDFEDESSSHDDSSDQEEAATSSEKSSVEPLINERATAINQAIRFPDSVHRSPGASIWTPEPSSTESSPDLVPWSPKEVHFSLPNSPIVAAGAASASMSATVPGEIEPLVLAHNSSEAMDQTDSDLESVNEKLTSPKMTEDFDNSVTRETETSDSKSSNFGESSFALPIAAAAATAAAVVPAVLSSESEDSTVARDLVEGASTEDLAHFSGMEFASVDDNFKSNAMESEQAQDLAIVSNTEVSVMKDESISRDMEITSVPDQDSSNSVAPTSDILPSHAFNTMTPKLALRSPGADVWTPEPPSTDSSPAIEPWSPKEVQFSIPDSPVVNDADISKLSTEILPPLGSAVNDITTDAESESEFKDATFEQSTSPVSQPIHFDNETSSAPSASQNLVTPSSPRSFLEEPMSVSEISSDSESDEEFKFSAAPTDKNEQTVSTPRNFSDFEASSSAAPAREFSIPASELYKDVGVFIPSDPEQNDQFVSRSYPSEPSFSTQRDEAENRNEQRETHENSFGGFQTIAPLALGASALGAGALLGSALPIDSVNSLNTNFTSESTSTLTVSDSLEGGSSNASFVSSVDKSPAAFSEVLAPQHRHSPSRSVSDESFVSVPEDQGDDNRLSMASSVNILESFVAESTQVMEDYPDFAPQSPIESVSSTRSLESSPGDGNVTASLLDPVPRTVIDSHMGVQKSGFETQTINISASIPDLSSIQPEDDPLNSDSDCDDEKEEVNANSNNLPMESLFDRSKFVASETSDIRSSTPIDTSDLSYGKNEPLPGSAIPAQDSSLKSLFTFNETASAASSQPDVESYDEIDNNQDVDSNSDISDESSVIEQSPIQSKVTKTEINDFPEDNQVSTRGWEQENTDSDSDSDSDSEPVTVSQIPIQTEFVEKDVQDSSQVAPILVPETEDHLEESSLTSESDSVVITKTPSHRSIGDHEGDEELQEKPASLPKAVNEEKPEESQFDFRDSDGDFDATPVYKAYGSPMEVTNPAELVESSVWDKALDGESHANAVSGENSFFDFAETTVRSDNSFLATSEVNSGSPETPRSQVSFSSPTKTPAATTEDFESSVHQETEKAILQTRSVSNSTDTSLEDDWFALSKAEAPVIPASPEAPLPRSPDETFTFPSLNKPLPSIAAPVPEVDTHKSFADTLERDDIGLTRDINASNSTTSLSESIVLVDPKDKPLPSLAPSALLPDADVKSRRSPSVTLTPIVKETESVVKDEGNIIFAVCVVGFHHAHGPQVEYWKGCDGDQSKLWPDLPFQSLPDGSHSREENFCYFTLPYDTVNKTAPLVVPTRNKEGEIIEDVSDMDSATTLFGISCNRQISADDLKEKPADVTRSTVHKSVVVIARKPIFGPIREKLAVITRAFFEQGDFSDLSLIDNLYDNLNVMFDTQLDENDMYVGMSLRELIFHMKNNVLVLFKALLLEKKIIFYSKNTENLCSSQFSLVSLVPALLEHLEDSCSPLLHKYEDTVKKPLSLKSSDRNSLLRFMGLPLQPFSEGGMFNPYLPLQQFNKVNAPETKYFLVGSTNSLIVESCECDLVVKFDQGIVEFKDNNLKKALALSTNDKKWMDYITQSVVETWDPKDPWKPKGLGFHGSEDFVRQQFEDYIMGFMSSVKYDEFLSRFSNQPPKMMMLREVDGNPVKLFSQTWVQEWKKTNNYRIFSKLTDDEIFDIVEPKHMAMTLMPPKETHQRSASTLSQISFFSSKSDESKTQQQAGGATSPASTKTWGSFLWRKPGTPSSPTSPPSVRDEGLYPGRLRANTVSTNHSVHTLEPIMSNGSEDALDTDSSPSAKSASSIPPPAAPAPTTTASQAASARRTASAGGFLTGWSSFWGSRKPAAAPAAADSADTVPAVTTTPPAATSPTEAPAGADGLASPLPHPALQSPKSVDNPAN